MTFPEENANDSFISNNNINFNTTNSSLLLIGQWTVTPVFSLLTFLTGLTLNAIVLSLFIKDPLLRTSFNIYLVNLLMANILLILFQYSLDIINNLYSLTWFLGDRVCTLYIYANFILQAAVFNSHLLIAINRIWAVVHPISYRSIHSIHVAICFCVAMWIYIHFIVAPGWIMDAMFYRLPVETAGCLLNSPAQPTWGIIVQIVIFSFPHVVMLLAMPIIYFKMRKRKVKSNAIIPSTKSIRVSNGAATSREIESVNTRTLKKRNQSVISASSHGYILLSLLTISVTICWTPIDVYYLLQIFFDFDQPLYYQIATILFSFQTTMDPIMFTFAIKQLRDAAKRVLQLS